MGTPNRIVNVRLPEDLADDFEKLAEQVPGLPKSVLMRLLLAHCLSKPMSEQIQIVTQQILKKDNSSAKPTEIAGNTNKRRY